jgi:hypothetical protein
VGPAARVRGGHARAYGMQGRREKQRRRRASAPRSAGPRCAADVSPALAGADPAAARRDSRASGYRRGRAGRSRTTEGPDGGEQKRSGASGYLIVRGSRVEREDGRGAEDHDAVTLGWTGVTEEDEPGPRSMPVILPSEGPARRRRCGVFDAFHSSSRLAPLHFPASQASLAIFAQKGPSIVHPSTTA